MGDADQLPSVGFGNVFADLIQSRAMPVVSLRQIFRQARQSRIVTNAHLVNQGQMPAQERVRLRFVPIATLRGSRIDPRRRGCRPRQGRALEEINVLTPMRKTEAGVFASTSNCRTRSTRRLPKSPKSARPIPRYGPATR